LNLRFQIVRTETFIGGIDDEERIGGHEPVLEEDDLLFGRSAPVLGASAVRNAVQFQDVAVLGDHVVDLHWVATIDDHLWLVSTFGQYF
jgi:hypothetical protein